MISSLRGTVLDIGSDYAVIECAGVGYLVNAAPSALNTLVRGEESTLLTSLAVKEDSMTLYGFASPEHRDMFHVLQGVSGMGPKLAMGVLSTLEPGDIARALRAEDQKTLLQVSGVGKRMAQRLIVELKDKVDGLGIADVEGSAGEAGGAAGGAGEHQDLADRTVEALEGLGLPEKETRSVVNEVITRTESEGKTLELSQVLSATLSQLGTR